MSSCFSVASPAVGIVFFIFANSIDEIWYFIVVFNLHFLISNEIKNLLGELLTCFSSYVNCLSFLSVFFLNLYPRICVLMLESEPRPYGSVGWSIVSST